MWHLHEQEADRIVALLVAFNIPDCRVEHERCVLMVFAKNAREA